MERETGLEPATSGLGSRDSTTELHSQEKMVPSAGLEPAKTKINMYSLRYQELLPSCLPIPPQKAWSERRDSNPRPTVWKTETLPLSYTRKFEFKCLKCAITPKGEQTLPVKGCLTHFARWPIRISLSELPTHCFIRMAKS